MSEFSGRKELNVAINENVMMELEDHSYESGVSIPDLLEEAVFELLKKKHLRPIYLDEMDMMFGRY